MIDSDELAGLPTRQLLDAVISNHRAMREAECSQLLLAAAWADDQDRGPDDDFPALVNRSTVESGGGRPQIDEHAVAEFGAAIGVGMVAARNLIGDAVDLRWRFPLIWGRVRAAALAPWQARKIVQGCTDLSWEQCAEVDGRLAGHIGVVPWPRLERLLLAAILEVDPDGVKARDVRARTERFVRAHESRDGLKLLVARATSGDVTWFMAAVNRIADILKIEGDADPVEVRRSKAVGILAHPARALQLLAAHTQHGPDGDVLSRPEDCIDPAVPREQREPTDVVQVDDETGEVLPSVDERDSAERTHVSLPDAANFGLSNEELDRALHGRNLQPRATLYFHISDVGLRGGEYGLTGLARPEHGGPLSLIQLHEFLADTGCQLTVRPVLDPAAVAPVDAYEIPQRIREALRLRNPVDVFPYGSSDLRSLDLDHTVPYRPGGPPGQTGIHNLGPLSRSAHRACTPRVVTSGGRTRVTGRWRKRQPSPGLYVWRSPHGEHYLTSHQGTLALGSSAFARQVWQQAAKLRPRQPSGAQPPDRSGFVRAS